MTDDNDEFLDDEPIESMFDDHGAMKEEHLSEAYKRLAMLAAKMDADPSLTSSAKTALAEAMIEPLRPHWGKAPEGATCSVCGSANVERSGCLIGGPFQGSYRCLDCGDVRSIMSHIIKTCIKVEPMPQGAALTYERDTDKESE